MIGFIYRESFHGGRFFSVTLTRDKSQPVSESYSFEVPESGSVKINVINGDRVDKGTMVSSATIDLSPGGRVVAPSDLNKNVDLVVKPVHLEPGEYTLEIEVRSQPGSYLTVVLSDRDFSQMEALP